MKLSEKQQHFAYMVGKLLIFVRSLDGYGVTFGDAYRSPKMATIYAKRGIGIKASKHSKRLAVDLNLFINGKYQMKTIAYKKLGELWKSLDKQNVWGGDWRKRDGNHFEYNG